MTNTEILKSNGYTVWQTGGGCTSWGKDFENGKSVLIGRDSRHNVDDDAEYDNLGIKVGAQFNTEQEGFISVESKKNDAQALINFSEFLNDMDNEALQTLSEFEPNIEI